MLNEYKRKRNFERTAEPAPETRPRKGALSFVVQKHSARRLHYDFRLAMDGVLKSWAVPNGFSLDPHIKRFAVMVEDHPLDYASFEGEIPVGEYGAGQVIVWDRGSYIPIEDGKGPITERSQAESFLRTGLEKGKISFLIEGSKLKGSWALVKMQRTKNDWLLIKHQDEFAKRDGDVQKDEKSVLSGLTIEDLKKIRVKSVTQKIKSPFPSSISPMLATLIARPFSDPGWFFEPKLDGYRTLTFIHDGKVKLLSRRGLDVTGQYPQVIKSLTKLKDRELVLDGEIVAIDEAGHTCLQCLQNRSIYNKSLESKDRDSKAVIIYYVFDLLYQSGEDLHGTPLYQRKALLEKALIPDEYVRLVDYFEKDGEALFEASVKQGLEGVVAKHKDSVYEDGVRSNNWLKIKATNSDEFIIAGYTRGTGNRVNTFGALVLGAYDNQGQLVFVGHVGTGFDDSQLAQLRKQFDSLITTQMPFAEKPASSGPVTWIKPEIVAEVKYAERTQEGLLRAPVFLRLRDDKSSQEVKITQKSNDPTELSEPKIGKVSPESDTVNSILEQLNNPPETFNLEVEGNTINLSNLDKALWPAVDKSQPATKRDLIRYLLRVSPFLLPHLQDRPLTLTRYPNGISGEHFYQKHSENPPDFVKTVALSERSSESRNYLLCNNLSTLIWLGQMANIDIHTWFSRITPEPGIINPDLPAEYTPDFYTNYPDFIIFDIDPYIYSGKEAGGAEPELNREAFKQTCQVALWLKEVLDGLGLKSFVKTSGRTGLHIFVPIVRNFDFQAVHATSKTISTFVLQKHPAEITVEWTVAKRTGKIFLDYNQNIRGKTLASIYSPRPSPQATISTPLQWNELEKIYPTDFTIFSLPDRLYRVGDIWSDILAGKTDLNKVIQQ